MNIEELTSESNLDASQFRRHRKILADEFGELRLVGMHFGDEEEGTEFVSLALVFLPEDGTAPRMVCAGRVGPWMKDVADEFILEREHMKMTGEDRVVSSMCPVAVYEAAARKGYSLLQHPNGELEFSKTEEGHRLSITNEVWSGDEVGSISAGAETWRVTQVEIECGEEVADTVVLEGTSLPEAFATAQQLSTITPAREADGSLTTMYVFATREEFLRTTGVDDVEIDSAAFEAELDYEFDLDPESLIFREEMTPSGMQLAMF